MGRLIALIAAMSLALVGGTAAAQQKQPRSFAPVGPWAMEYADSNCRLIRNFSDGRDSITVAFIRNGLTTGLQLGLAGRPILTYKGRAEFVFHFQPGDDPRRRYPLITKLADGRPSLLIETGGLVSYQDARQLEAQSSGPLMPVFLDREAAAAGRIDALLIERGLRDEIEIRLGSLAEPYKALRKCVDDLLKGWGVDPVKYASSKLPVPVDDPNNWLGTDDYPKAMVYRGRSGIVDIRLVVAEDGKVEACHIDTEKRGPFEDATCAALLKRARFDPGRDADGKPMRSYWTKRVNYVL